VPVGMCSLCASAPRLERELQGGRTVSVDDVQAVRPHLVVEDARHHGALAGEPLRLVVPGEDRQRQAPIAGAVVAGGLVGVAPEHAPDGLVQDQVAPADLRLLLGFDHQVEPPFVVAAGLPRALHEDGGAHRLPVAAGALAEAHQEPTDADLAVDVRPEQRVERRGELVVAGHDDSFGRLNGVEPVRFEEHLTGYYRTGD